MVLSKTATLAACFAIGVIGSFLLMRVIPAYRGIAFVLLIAGIIAAFVTLLGVFTESRWGYPFATLLFTLGIANSTLLYYILGRHILTYTLTLLALTLGLVISISSIGSLSWEEEPAPPVAVDAPKKRRGRPRKK